MANLRQIRSRIRSVQNTQKITRAMQMVAGAKLRRAQGQLFQARPYVDRLDGIVQRFLAAAPTLTHPLLTPPKGTVPRHRPSGQAEGDCPPIALVVVTSDAGLCGAYNERLLATAQQALAEGPACVIPIGRKGLAAARRHGWPILAHYTELGGKVAEPFVRQLAQTLMTAYQDGRVSGVRVIYTAFRSALSWRPMVEGWLPLRPPRPDDAAPAEDSLWEPTPAEIAERLLPASLTAKLRRLLLEAVTSEHSARMVAMKAATDNAAEMLDALTLTRNKVRQASITKEISEIVAGAEALKG